MNKKLITYFGIISLCLMAGCEQKGSMEKAGERTDEIIDNIKDGDPILHEKGAAEKAGEAIDNAVNTVKAN